ncbi:hypothetical protein GCM10027563_13870 [Parasphingorhabdus pacifica]
MDVKVALASDIRTSSLDRPESAGTRRDCSGCAAGRYGLDSVTAARGTCRRLHSTITTVNGFPTDAEFGKITIDSATDAVIRDTPEWARAVPATPVSVAASTRTVASAPGTPGRPARARNYRFVATPGQPPEHALVTWSDPARPGTGHTRADATLFPRNPGRSREAIPVESHGDRGGNGRTHTRDAFRSTERAVAE